VIVLDTDILSILQRGGGADYERLVPQMARHAGEEAALTIISFEEQTRGWLAQLAKNKRPDDQVAAYLRFHRLLGDYARCRVLDFTPEAAVTYASLRRAFRRHGSADLKIAAIAITHNALLISANARDFTGLTGLRFEPLR
jgi:tRNA(fMet)-specific endonuclease VapC